MWLIFQARDLKRVDEALEGAAVVVSKNLIAART